MRLIIEPLKTPELRFILDVLNTPATRNSITTLRAIDDAGKRFSRKALRGKINMEPWHYGKVPSNDQLVVQCSAARRSIASAVVEQRAIGGFFFELKIGLPAYKPPVVVTDISELADWFLARAVANRQHLRFVKCSREDCGRFGLRVRARASSRYCSRNCQIADTALRAKMREPKKVLKHPVRFAAPEGLRDRKTKA